MRQFYQNFSFFLSFMILINIFNMTLGPNFTEKFLLLVLLGMVVLNADAFDAILKGA